jgi:hypothetical protein
LVSAIKSYRGSGFFLLNSFVSSSVPLQYGMVHEAAAAGVGYTALLHTQLFHIFPGSAAKARRSAGCCPILSKVQHITPEQYHTT